MNERKRLTRAEMRDRTRSGLLEAATRVFARRGYRAASMDEIAEEAGYSKGAVYSNFESKEDLFLTLFQEHMAEHLAATTKAFSEGATPQERLTSGSRHLSLMAEEDQEWCLLLMEFWSHAAREPKLREAFAADYDSWRQSVARLVESQAAELGLPLAIPADEIASAIIALFEGFVLQKMIQPDRFPADYFGSMLMTFLAGVAAMSGADLAQVVQGEPAR